jgi:hypothetical protein
MRRRNLFCWTFFQDIRCAEISRVAGRGRIERTTEIAAADLADLFWGETLLHHLLHDCVIESDLLVRPGLVGPLADTLPPATGCRITLTCTTKKLG